MAQLRAQVFAALEGENRAGVGRLVDRALALLIVANVAAVILESDAAIYAAHRDAFFLFEAVSTVIFTIEYGLRLWSATSDPELAPLGPLRARLRYMRRPLAIIDLAALLPFYLSWLFGADLRMLRIFRLLRFLKLARYSSALALLWRVLIWQRHALLAATMIMLIMLLISATLMHQLEHRAQPDAFGSIASAMWWAVATLTTVGYGDVTPVTPLGKLMGGVVMIIGVGVFALPVGVLATGFQEEIQRRDALVTWNMVARVPLFETLSASEVMEITRILETRRVRRGEVIMRPGEAADAMFFVSNGQVELRYGGAPIRLDVGDFFGERAMLPDGVRKGRASAITDVDLLALERSELIRLMEEHPELERTVSDALAEKEASGDARLRDFGRL